MAVNGPYIRQLRQAARLTQKEVAGVLGWDHSYIHLLETGKRRREFNSDDHLAVVAAIDKLRRERQAEFDRVVRGQTEDAA